MAEGRPEAVDDRDWAVDGSGKKLRFPDGTLISGSAIEQRVQRSGMQLTNTEAAEAIIATDGLVDSVTSRLSDLREEHSGHEVM